MRFIACTILLSGMFSLLGGQADSHAGNDDGLFSSDSLLELALRADLDALCADVGDAPSWHPALIEYTDPATGEAARMDMEVRTRGNFRKNPENCDFPPLKIKFSKTGSLGSIFENSRELKLVTHCQNGEEDFEQYVLQEYLIYKGYNLFTDFSLRVRLARISYINTSSGDSIVRFAFMIEDPDDMAKRHNGKILDIGSAPMDRVDQFQLGLMALYNYMILNTDYSVPVVHNIEMVSTDHFQPPVPVPYDFDWSGIINIPYDSPYADEKTRYSGRRYKGPCMKYRQFEQLFQHMYERRAGLYRLYRDFPYLDEDLRSRCLQEINMFYITIGNRGLIRREFIKNCID